MAMAKILIFLVVYSVSSTAYCVGFPSLQCIRSWIVRPDTSQKPDPLLSTRQKLRRAIAEESDSLVLCMLESLVEEKTFVQVALNTEPQLQLFYIATPIHQSVRLSRTAIIEDLLAKCKEHQLLDELVALRDINGNSLAHEVFCNDRSRYCIKAVCRYYQGNQLFMQEIMRANKSGAIPWQEIWARKDLDLIKEFLAYFPELFFPPKKHCIPLMTSLIKNISDYQSSMNRVADVIRSFLKRCSDNGCLDQLFDEEDTPKGTLFQLSVECGEVEIVQALYEAYESAGRVPAILFVPDIRGLIPIEYAWMAHGLADEFAVLFQAHVQSDTLAELWNRKSPQRWVHDASKMSNAKRLTELLQVYEGAGMLEQVLMAEDDQERIPLHSSLMDARKCVENIKLLVEMHRRVKNLPVVLVKKDKRGMILLHALLSKRSFYALPFFFYECLTWYEQADLLEDALFSKDAQGESPLQAALANCPDSVAPLVAKARKIGCSKRLMQAVDSTGCDSLHSAIKSGVRSSVVAVIDELSHEKILIEALCLQDINGNTPLLQAICRHDAASVSLLLEAAKQAGCRADMLCIRDNKGHTPLHCAVLAHSVGVTEYILSAIDCEARIERDSGFIAKGELPFDVLLINSGTTFP